MNGSVWARIAEFPDYAISGEGAIMRLTGGTGLAKAGRILKPKATGKYPAIVLCRNGATWTRSIHKLVAQHFVPNPDNKPEVNHKDGNKQNFHFSNLEWSTEKENMRHAAATGLLNPAKGEHHYAAKLNWKKVRAIRRLRNTGTKIAALAARFGVSLMTISQVCSRKTWKVKMDTTFGNTR